ncbi:MAG TPA: type VI secretion system baseplate subunit TssK [Nannocystis sp.]|jgi:type VI secretion system protein ImpJ
MNRPLWTEGTLLCPQHMQQQDLYHEHNLAARLAAALPHPWGITALRFDPAALQSGQLALTILRAVLPDGTCIELDDRSPQPPPTRQLAPHFAARSERVPVWLTVPVLRPGLVNSAAEPTAQHRYRTVTRDHFDLSLTRSARPLEQSEPNLALRLGDEPRDDLVCLPLAEVVRDPGGSFVLDETFIPPISTVAAAPPLRATLQNLCALVGARRRTLADDRRRHHDLPRALFFHALSGALPLLRHLADSPDTTPLQLYQHLLRLAGELRSFGDPGEPGDPTPYDFADLRACLGPLLSDLRQRVVDTLPDRFLRVPLEPRADGLWIGELRDDRLLRCTSFVLAVEAGADPAVLSSELPALTRIAAWRRINLIVRNNVLGAPIRAVTHPPVELPVLPRHAYFTITPDDPSWLEVLRERNVAIYLPRPYDPEHARITLMAIPDEA